MWFRQLCVPSLLGWCLALPVVGLAQEQSVKPGINDSFKNPDIGDFVGKFEVESREVYHLREAILAACRIEPGQTVADIGAGTGLYTRMFSNAVGKDGRVIAVDITPKFLSHIEATCRAEDLKNVQTLLCGAETTNLAPESVDVAFICDTYHHFEFPLKTMTSLHKALKPGGRVIVVDFRRVEGESTPWVLNHVRAGQEVVESEIKECGFRKVGERKGLFKENYFVEFQKLDDIPDLKTSLIPGIGGVTELTGAPEGPRVGARVVFDVTAASKSTEINAGLERAARVLNLYGAAGLKATDVRIAVILHGDAAATALTHGAYSKQLQTEKNPNIDLIADLRAAGVDVMICGQTLARKKIPQSDIAEGVVVATSAMTALMNRQSDGYSLLRVQ
jgi:ubiquinone/menaquinone biosynthesis C-methylase UbiE/intracellular sulfur oxidation DsrE/DsrF family protein